MKAALGLISLVILILIFFFVGNNSGFIDTRINQPAAKILTSPSPGTFPFQELTIPYLRLLKYESSLGDLDRVSSNGNYTNFLTSYSSDGLRINGLLTKPAGEKPEGGWSAIVFIHGYIPPSQYQTLEKYTAYVDFLARNGFVVFKIDLRGNGDSEGEPGGAYYSSDYVIDVLNAYSALQNSDFVNPKKIGLWGHSMAGNIVLRSLAVKPEIPAAVIWAGAGYTYKDLSEYRLRDASYLPQPSDSVRQRKRQEIRDKYGNPEDGNPFWNLVAPANYLGGYKGAIQLNHAVNDDVVSIEYSRNLNKLLDQTKVPHELHEYADGGHNITDPYFSQAMENTVEFFKKYLD